MAETLSRSSIDILNDENFGIRAYVDGKTIFSGQLKTFAEDFYVTEISQNGQVVELIPDTILSTQNQSTDCEMSGSTKELQPYFTPPKDFAEASLELNTLIGDQMNSELKEFAQSKHNNLKKCYQSSLSIPLEQICIGDFTDKLVRAKIHKLIRSVFPHLVTKTVGTQIFTHSNPHYSQLMALLSSEEEVLGFLKFIGTCEKNQNESFLLKPNPNKEQREKIHKLIYKLYGKFMISHTLTKERPKGSNLVEKYSLPDTIEDPIICLHFKNGKSPLSSMYTEFVIEKINKDTLVAIGDMSRALSCGPSKFSFAGIKDKKAITLQQMTVKNFHPKCLKRKFAAANFSGIRTGSYKFTNTQLYAGCLQGNRFSLIIRNIQSKSKIIATSELKESVIKRVNSILNTGFCNYFGLQRFGSYSHFQCSSAHIGMYILRRDFKTAINKLLTPSPKIPPTDSFNLACNYYQETNDLLGTYNRMPRSQVNLRSILGFLKQSDSLVLEDSTCQQALLRLPYYSRTFYVHAFSSMLWNHMLSHRIETYGFQAVPGDLVIQNKIEDVPSSKRFKPDPNECENSIVASESSIRDSVIIIDKNNYTKFSIYDVVLPLCGCSISYPNNSTGELYQSLLSELLLHQQQMFNLSELQMKFAGSYRYLMSKPSNLSYSFHSDDIDESQLNFKLEFDLKRSNYATVFLREIIDSV